VLHSCEKREKRKSEEERSLLTIGYYLHGEEGGKEKRIKGTLRRSQYFFPATKKGERPGALSPARGKTRTQLGRLSTLYLAPWGKERENGNAGS